MNPCRRPTFTYAAAVPQVWFQNRRQRESTGRVAPRSDLSAETEAESLPLATVAGIDDYAPADSLGHPSRQPMSATDLRRLLAAENSTTAGVSSAGQVSEGRPTSDMRMETFTSLFPPFEVLWASADWLDFCGFADYEVAGQV